MSKRMISDAIVESDAFLDMPLTSQALYIHLVMNADNDGFVSPKRVMRVCGAAADDLQILLAKRFILQFDSGVAVIKHWWINNTKRTDRYAPTSHHKELAQLLVGENNAYTIITTYDPELSEVEKLPARTRQESGSGFLPQHNVIQHNEHNVIQHNSVTAVPAAAAATLPGDDKLAKQKPERIAVEILDGLFAYWHQQVGFEISGMGNRQAAAALYRQHGPDKLKRLIDGAKQALDDRYAPRISDFVSLKRKQNDLIIWGRKRGQESNVEVIS